MEEVRIALFDLGADKALGLDGFPTFFFQRLWFSMVEELLEVVEESRVGGFVLRDFNNTFIALIPKRDEIKIFGDFRRYPYATPFIRLYLRLGRIGLRSWWILLFQVSRVGSLETCLFMKGLLWLMR